MTQAFDVAIVHHHLRLGGVTEVIRRALDSLTGSLAGDGVGTGVRACVLTGEAPHVAMPEGMPVEVVPGLAYARFGAVPDEWELLAELRGAARRALGRAPDLWHFHNHALGKNPAFTSLPAHLASDGERVLLQIHDFAEDGRPANYRFLARYFAEHVEADRAARIYPHAPHVHYAVLNRRDRGVLHLGGVREARLHLLPNPVAPAPPASSAASLRVAADRVILYPTRGIGRKNLGELLLWAAVARDGDLFATSLTPLNPAEAEQHARWEAVAAELGLPIELGIGERSDMGFFDLLRAAHRVVTTSLAEGFGMCFLEPWLVERQLVGRDLPEITGDFSAAGLRLRGLYGRILVPLDWLERGSFAKRVRAGMRRMLEAYGRGADIVKADEAVAAAVVGDRVDFGALDASMQERVIRRLCASAEARSEIEPHELDATPLSARTLEGNRLTIEQQFSMASYGERLVAAYRQLLDADVEPVGGLDAGRILDAFLAPARFRLLRS